MRKIKRQIVSAVIISKDNKILFGKKDPKKGGVYPDCWHIPGGGIEENESREEALAREIKEEVGIDISKEKIELISDDDTGEAKKTLGTGERVLVSMYFFTYKVVLGKNSEKIKIQSEDDLFKLQWFDINSLSTLKLTPPSMTLFKKIGFIK